MPSSWPSGAISQAVIEDLRRRRVLFSRQDPRGAYD